MLGRIIHDEGSAIRAKGEGVGVEEHSETENSRCGITIKQLTFTNIHGYLCVSPQKSKRKAQMSMESIVTQQAIPKYNFNNYFLNIDISCIDICDVSLLQKRNG